MHYFGTLTGFGDNPSLFDWFETHPIGLALVHSRETGESLSLYRICKVFPESIPAGLPFWLIQLQELADCFNTLASFWRTSADSVGNLLYDGVPRSKAVLLEFVDQGEVELLVVNELLVLDAGVGLEQTVEGLAFEVALEVGFEYLGEFIGQDEAVVVLVDLLDFAHYA